MNTPNWTFEFLQDRFLQEFMIYGSSFAQRPNLVWNMNWGLSWNILYPFILFLTTTLSYSTLNQPPLIYQTYLCIFIFLDSVFTLFLWGNIPHAKRGWCFQTLYTLLIPLYVKEQHGYHFLGAISWYWNKIGLEPRTWCLEMGFRPIPFYKDFCLIFS